MSRLSAFFLIVALAAVAPSRGDAQQVTQPLNPVGAGGAPQPVRSNPGSGYQGPSGGGTPDYDGPSGGGAPGSGGAR